MSLAYTAKFIGPSADETKSHVLGYSTARAAATSLLNDIWNGATSAGRKWAIDLNGKQVSAAYTAGDVLFASTGVIAGVRRIDGLALGTANQLLRVNAGATAPEWASTLSGLTLTSPTITGTGAAAFSTLATSGLLSANAGLTVASGQTLTLTGATITGFTGNITGNCSGTAATVTGATQASITTCANLTTVGALNAGSITSGFGSIDIGADALTCGALTATTGTFSGNFEVASDAAPPNTASYAPFGVTRPATAGNHAYIGLTKAGTWPGGFGLDTASSLIYGSVTVTTKLIATPLFTLTTAGALTLAAGLTATGGFGCNGKAAQGAYAAGGLLAGVVAALIANGILSS